MTDKLQWTLLSHSQFSKFGVQYFQASGLWNLQWRECFHLANSPEIFFSFTTLCNFCSTPNSPLFTEKLPTHNSPDTQSSITGQSSFVSEARKCVTTRHHYKIKWEWCLSSFIYIHNVNYFPLNERPCCANTAKCSFDCISSILCYSKYLQDQYLHAFPWKYSQT